MRPEIDRRLEILGISKMRSFVRQLPVSEDAAIVWLLNELKVPPAMWEPMLLSMIYTVPGWFAWTRYQANERGEKEVGRNDFVGLLAIRLAYEVALARSCDFTVDWSSYQQAYGRRTSFVINPERNVDAIARHVLLRASEVAYRERLLGEMAPLLPLIDAKSSKSTDSMGFKASPKLAQMVFCIDVRSERIRRHIEQVSSAVETFGFAGFFGVSMEYVPLGHAEGSSQVPVLLKPQMKVHEGVCAHTSCEGHASSAILERRKLIRSFRSLWKSFASSAATCFSYVETSGLLYASKLLRRNLGMFPNAHDVAKFDGLPSGEQFVLGPTLEQLEQQGFDEARLIDMAESILRNLGLMKNFAQLVVFCGHGSETEKTHCELA